MSLTDRQTEIIGEIKTLAQEYMHDFESEWADALVTHIHVIGEAMLATEHRSFFEIRDRSASQYTAMGLLFSALHDPRWLPKPTDD